MFHESTIPTDDAKLFNYLCPKSATTGKRAFARGMIPRLEGLGITKRDPSELTLEEISRFARLDVDPSTVTWRRVVDVNDRMVRGITVGEGKEEKGFNRKTGFDISGAAWGIEF